MSAKVNSDMTQVLFDKPVTVEIAAPTPVGIARTARTNFTYDEIAVLVKRYIEDGFGDRAVVCRNMGHRSHIMAPINWGVVIDQNRSPTYDGTAYAPIKVRWIRDGVMTSHWPEDLYLLHRPLTVLQIDKIVEESQ